MTLETAALPLADTALASEPQAEQPVAVRAAAAPAVHVEQSIDDFIGMALRDPSIDVGKLDALLRMKREAIADQERIEDRDSILEFNDAMSACQAEIAPVARTAENKQTNSLYAKLEAVDAAIRPIYTKHGFSLSFDEEATADNKNMMIVCHVSRKRHTRKYRMFAPPDTLGPKGTPVKTELHGRGSTTTFLRRYLECNIFNVVLKDLDDDGNLGGAKFVSAENRDRIEKLIEETRSDADKFLEYYQVAHVGNLTEEQGVQAINKLEQKLRAMRPVA